MTSCTFLAFRTLMIAEHSLSSAQSTSSSTTLSPSLKIYSISDWSFRPMQCRLATCPQTHCTLYNYAHINSFMNLFVPNTSTNQLYGMASPLSLLGLDQICFFFYSFCFCFLLKFSTYFAFYCTILGVGGSSRRDTCILAERYKTLSNSMGVYSLQSHKLYVM